MTQWKLVPVKPTPEMMKAGVNVKPYTASRIYAAMLAAAPEPESEPVYWQWRRKGQPWSLENTFNCEVQVTTKDSERRALYTAPQPAKQPLTDEQIDALFDWGNGQSFRGFARAIEAAHGISKVEGKV